MVCENFIIVLRIHHCASVLANSAVRTTLNPNAKVALNKDLFYRMQTQRLRGLKILCGWCPIKKWIMLDDRFRSDFWIAWLDI